MKNFTLKKVIKRIIPTFQNRQVFELSDIPTKYKKLVKKIMKASPIWGSHQTIKFPDGFILKGGRDQSRLGMFNLPTNLQSVSILDIGCNLGGLSIECKKRNAKRVLGLDKSKILIECANEISNIFKLEVEYRIFDIIQEEIIENFDYVFMLNVFHHLDEKGKIKILRNVDKITEKKFYFEAPIKGDCIAEEDRCMKIEDYLRYLKEFTTFNKIDVLGKSDFNRPIVICEKQS